jgi:acyl dehydratase
LIEFPTPSAIRDRLNDEVAVGEWVEITQTRIDQFADATEDHQWIHVDAARAAVESPFRATIAHGFLTLSLVSVLLRRAVRIDGLRMAINYGLNRVRFVAPVPVGSRIRGRFRPLSIEEAGGAVQVVWAVTVERDGSDKPCAVVEWVVRYYPTDQR